jgi:quercetin dioxygenase-like cupin family protein
MKRIFLTAFGFAAGAFAQDMVSARAGMIQHIEGDVKLDGKTVAMPSRDKMFSQFPEVKKGLTLATTEGRAEILLSPGVTLRLGEESAFTMIDSALSDTKVELKAGAAVVEVLELVKDNVVSMTVGQSTIQFRKAGTYKIHASDTREIMVYDGQADVTIAGQTKTAKKGNVVSLENVALARKFDTEKGDSLLRWSMRRSGYMAMANVSAASAASMSGNSMYSGSRGMGGWYWNPYYMMYTYLPYSGMFCNSYVGSCFYSPGRVYQAFYTPPVYSAPSGGAAMSGPSYGYNQSLGYSVAGGSRGYSGISTGGGGSVSGGAPAAAASAPAASGGGRSGGDAGGRGGSGGGRAQ